MRPGDLVRPRGLSYVSNGMVGLILEQLYVYATPHFKVLWGGEECLIEDGRDLEMVDETR